MKHLYIVKKVLAQVKYTFEIKTSFLYCSFSINKHYFTYKYNMIFLLKIIYVKLQTYSMTTSFIFFLKTEITSVYDKGVYAPL